MKFGYSVHKYNTGSSNIMQDRASKNKYHYVGPMYVLICAAVWRNDCATVWIRIKNAVLLNKMFLLQNHSPKKVRGLITI